MENWATENFENVNIERLKPYENNSRIHTEEQIKQIENAIQEWGWTMPILIDEDYTIIAGHARYIAASNLELSMVPTLMAKGWTDKQKQAFVIADNRISENSSWDMGLLHSELKQLADNGFNVDLTGFDNSMLANFSPTVMPSMSYNEISQDDIYNAEQNQNNISSNEVHTQDVVCPKCLHQFEISGNN
tara:strand:- start:1311 stop:1877 length:567 start_codon:yes stop_codon:yes gene_type:complete